MDRYESVVKKGPHKNGTGSYQIIIEGFKEDLDKDVFCTKQAVNIRDVNQFDKLVEGTSVNFAIVRRGKAIFTSDLVISELSKEQPTDEIKTTSKRYDSRVKKGPHDNGRGSHQIIIEGFKEDLDKDVFCTKQAVNIRDVNQFDKLVEGTSVNFAIVRRGNAIFTSDLVISNSTVEQPKDEVKTTSKRYDSRVKKGPHDNGRGSYQIIIEGFKEDLDKDVFCTEQAVNIRDVNQFNKLVEGTSVNFAIVRRGNAIFTSDLVISKSSKVEKTDLPKLSSVENIALSKSTGCVSKLEMIKNTKTAVVDLPNGKEVIFRRNNMTREAEFDELRENSIVQFFYNETDKGNWASDVEVLAQRDVSSEKRVNKDYSIDQTMMFDLLDSIKTKINDCKNPTEFEHLVHLVFKLLCGPTYTHFVPQSRQRSLPDGYVYLKEICIFYDATLEEKDSRDANKNSQREAFENQITSNSHVEEIGNHARGIEKPVLDGKRCVWFITRDEKSGPEHKTEKNSKAVHFKEVSIYDLLDILEKRLTLRRDLNEIPALFEQLNSL